MPKVEEPNDKVREQIEEILEQDERRKPEPIRIAKPVAPRKAQVRRSGTPFWYLTPEKLIALGIILMVSAVLARRFVLPLTLGGFILAGIGYYMIVMRRRKAKYGGTGSATVDTSARYWRGQRVDRPPEQVRRRNGNIIDFPDVGKSKSKRKK